MSDISDQRRYYERMMDEIAAERQEQFDQLKAENAKLVDVLHEVEQEAVYAYRCLQQDCVTIADSVGHFFKMWWHAECELDRTREENAKLREEQPEYQATIDSLVDECTDYKTENAQLRELVRDMWDFYCVMPDEPHVFKEELDFSAEVWKRMRELRIEVDE